MSIFMNFIYVFDDNLKIFQCEKPRSVCTITALDVDERSIAIGLGSCGKVIMNQS